MKRIPILLSAALAACALAGCNSSGSLGSTDPNKAVPAELQSPILNDESGNPDAAGMFAADEAGLDAVELLPAGNSKAEDALPDSVRLRWHRERTSFIDNWSRSGTADSVYVISERTVQGNLIGKLKQAHHPDSTVYIKPFGVKWSRTAIFKKIGVPTPDGEEGTLWVLQSLTLSHSTQTIPNLPTPNILSVTVSGRDSTGAPVSVTFTDPTAMYDPRSLPLFQLGDSIQVKVQTDGNAASQRAFFHFDMDGSDHNRCFRRPLAYNSEDGSFEGAFKVREGFGGHHRGNLRPRSAVWVDVLTQPTLYDTDPNIYAATGWGVPYRLLRHHPMHMAAAGN